MTTNKMLIDASHPEETRVVVLRDGRVEEFDYESTAREQLRGNIYLAKVTRVEPSLQAAFVDYGGNRHGFLAFSEIHPDYYQIPIADRQALLDEEAEEDHLNASEDNNSDGDTTKASSNGDVAAAAATSSQIEHDETDAPSDTKAEDASSASSDDDETGAVEEAKTAEETVLASKPKGRSFAERFLAPLLPTDYLKSSDNVGSAKTDDLDDSPTPHGLVEDSGVEEVNGNTEAAASGGGDDVDEIGEGDALEEVPVRKRRRRRHYKIQEVIKRGQIILVQVVKEERGNKGAALTTYMSLAGRYTVLMPNTARGGGISRKITNASDRNHLRKIANAIEVPKGMGLIIRTAGSSRTMEQINRDYEYLSRLWEKVRDLTMDSIAPCRVYEEGDLIKRSIRDLYTTEIDSIVVAGEQAHNDAHEFMKLIMPNQAKNVELYSEAKPLFAKYDIERQLAAMFSPFVTLPSGGYLVINQTEALVAIDINSGKSTRNSSIEETAFNTNLEASVEIARQLKLRDLAGLIVIDYIDMEERSNNRNVERRLKQSLQGDRARIQVGRISHFGLLEMSRQRLRTGVLEGSTSPCAQCQGTGMIRSTESVALSVIRALEDALNSGEKSALRANTSVDVALYILNSKRETLQDIEARYGVDVGITANDKLQGGNFSIERIGAGGQAGEVIMTMNWGAGAPESTGGRGERKPRKRGGRKRVKDSGDSDKPRQQTRGRKPKPRDDSDNAKVAEKADVKSDADGSEVVEATPGTETGDGEKSARKPRRRGRRGGRRNRGRNAGAEGEEGTANAEASANQNGDDASTEPPKGDADDGQTSEVKAEAADTGNAGDDGDAKAAPRKPRARRRPARSRSKPETSNGDASSDAKDPTVAKAEPKAKSEADTSQKSEVKASSDETPKPEKRTRKPRAPRTSTKSAPKTAPEQKSASASPDAASAGSTASTTPGGDDGGPAKSGWWQKRD